MDLKRLFDVGFLFVCLSLIGCSSAITPSQERADNAPTGLMVNLLTEADKSLITTPQPKFSWIVALENNGDSQAGYQILVSSSLENINKNIGDMYDSGVVSSSESLHVKYQGKALAENSRYFFKVRTFKGDGAPSNYSAVQAFRTGKFNKKRPWIGQSDWVKLPDGKWTFENRPPVEYHFVEPVLRKNFGDFEFFDFGKSAFSILKFSISKTDAAAKKIKVRIGEHSVDGKINRNPTGLVIFKEYDVNIEDGKLDYVLQIPRFVPRYPQSQVMPKQMDEVIPFRYCEIEGVKVSDVKQGRLHIPFNDNASYFKSSNDVLNKVYELCKHSVKINTFNGDYASSERERMMYESDTYIHQMGHYACDREFAIGRYSSENMIYHATWPTEWIPHSIFMAWVDYLYTGDNTSIKTHYEALKPKTLLGLKTPCGLISTRTGLMTRDFLDSINYSGKELRDIVDWPHGEMSPALPKCGETDGHDFRTYNTVVNAFHYRAMTLMSEIAKAVGNQDDAKFYAAQAASFKEIFNARFFDTTSGYYIDGLNSDFEKSPHSSIHSNLFALAFGLVEPEHSKGVCDFIISRKMACGVYSANYLIEALYDNSNAHAGYQLLSSTQTRSWYNMIRSGSTVTIESWDNKYKINNSWTHGWSSSPAHLIPRKIMGIEPIEAGFKTVSIRPNLDGLSFADCLLPTIRGSVKVSYKTFDGVDSYAVEIPACASAKLSLERSKKPESLTVNGEDTKFDFSDGRVNFKLPSGKYDILVK